MPLYDGAMTVPGIPTQILGVDENVCVFSILTLAMAAVTYNLRFLTTDA